MQEGMAGQPRPHRGELACTQGVLSREFHLGVWLAAHMPELLNKLPFKFLCRAIWFPFWKESSGPC